MSIEYMYGKTEIKTRTDKILTTATRVLVDIPPVPFFRLLNRWSANCASALFDRLVPPRSSEDSKSKTVKD